MRNICFLFIALILICSVSCAQSVAINTDGTAPQASAMLDIKNPNKGILIPRVALTGTVDLTTIPSPAVSLMVYNTATTTGNNSVTPGYYYWNGSLWLQLTTNGISFIQENSGFIGVLIGNNTFAFIGNTVSVTITSSTQKVFITAHAVLGTVGTAAGSLNLYPGYKLSTSSSIFAMGNGLVGLTCPINTKLVYSVTGTITGLTPGLYQFGMIGSTSDVNWVNNDYNSATVMVIN